MDDKPAIASKTLWFNVVTLVLAIAATLTANEWVASDETVMKVLVVITTAGNFALRFLTSRPVVLFKGGGN